MGVVMVVVARRVDVVATGIGTEKGFEVLSLLSPYSRLLKIVYSCDRTPAPSMIGSSRYWLQSTQTPHLRPRLDPPPTTQPTRT